MRTIQANGKSIDEAIFNGLKELEISIDEVDIEILQQESKGVLGFGAKPAIVRLIEREPEAIIVPEYLTEEAKKRREERAKEPRERSGGRYERRESGRGEPRAQGSYRHRDEKPRQGMEQSENDADADRVNSRGEHVINNRPESRRKEAPRRREESFERRDERRDMSMASGELPKIDYSAEAAQSEPAAIFLKGLLSQMNIDAEILANLSEAQGEEAAHTRLYIKAENMGVLIGHRGETLDALQYLTSLYVNRNRREKGYTRITIDTEGYRGKREETLTRLARKVAAQVRSTGRARVLEPMNPYERRVLHATLQPNPYVTTHSEGEEPYRRVVVEPKR